MIKIKNIIHFLMKKYSLEKAEPWDKVGLIYGDKGKQVQNILVTLDLTTEVLNYAMQKKCDLIIVHHPFLFEKSRREEFNVAPYKKMIDKRLYNQEIGVLVLHTNYDNSKEGTAFQLAQVLELKEWKFLPNSYYGIISDTKLTLEKIFNLIRHKLQITNFKTNFDVQSNMAFTKIAFLPGSGNPQDIIKAHQQGASLIFTSDIKWSTWIMAQEHNIKLIDYSHSVENVFTTHIMELITKKYKKITVFGYKVVIDNYLIGMKRGKND